MYSKQEILKLLFPRSPIPERPWLPPEPLTQKEDEILENILQTWASNYFNEDLI